MQRVLVAVSYITKRNKLINKIKPQRLTTGTKIQNVRESKTKFLTKLEPPSMNINVK